MLAIMFRNTNNNFTSGISTANPFGGSELRRATMGKSAYGGSDPSRSAFARSLLDNNNNEMKDQFDTAQQDYRLKAEVGRARDVQSQRENDAAKYQMQREREVTLRRQDSTKSQKMMDFDAFLDRARKDSRAATLGNYAQMVMSLAGAAAPTASQMAMNSNLGNTMRTGSLGLLGGLRGNVTDTSGWGNF